MIPSIFLIVSSVSFTIFGLPEFILVLTPTNIALLRVSILLVVEFLSILFELYEIKTSNNTEPVIKNTKVVTINLAFIVENMIFLLKDNFNYILLE